MSDAENEDTAPSPVERRRGTISNEVLAERLQNFRDNMQREFGALSATMERELAPLTRAFEKLDSRMGTVETFLYRLDERVKAVESFKAAQEAAEKAASATQATQLQAANTGATDARMMRMVLGGGATLILVLVAVIGLIIGTH